MHAVLRHAPADLRGGTKAIWEKWYEATLEEEKLQDIGIQCVDFCEATTSKMHAILQHAPFDMRGGTFRQHPRVVVATVGYQHRAAASALLADGWSTESVSRVVRTTRTRRENHEREHAEHVYYSHIHDGVTISDAFPVTRHGFNGGKHPAENTTAQDDQEDEAEQSSSESLQTRREISRIHENMGHTSNRNLFSRIFTEKVESDGNRREVTSLEAPWRSDKTERAGRDCKDDYDKMTQDGSEAPTRKFFEEDRVTVNQTKASKNNDSRDSEYQRVLGRNPLQVEDAVLECGEEGIGMISWQQTGGLAADPALDQQRRSKRALYYAAKHHKGKLPVGRPLWFRQPFHDDDETAHRHVVRDLGERLQHKDDLPDEDITGQDEPPVDSPPTQGEKAQRQDLQDPTAKDRWMWNPKNGNE